MNNLDMYKQVFEKTTDAILILHDNKIIDCNPSAIKIFGYKSKEELLEVHPADISPEKQEDLQNSLSKADLMIKTALTQKNLRFEWLHKKSNGTVFSTEVLLIHIGDYLEKPLLFAIIRDITRRKESEKELYKLNTAVNQSPSVMVLTDTAGNVIFVNPAFTDITGYSFGEVKNKNPRILKSGEMTDKFYSDLWQTISSGNTWTGEMSNKKKDGTIYWERAIISPVFDKNRQIINYLKIAEDITDKKKMEYELEKYREHLEELVDIRTKELNNRLKELENLNNLFVGRESRIDELRDEIRKLKKKLKIR